MSMPVLPATSLRPSRSLKVALAPLQLSLALEIVATSHLALQLHMCLVTFASLHLSRVSSHSSRKRRPPPLTSLTDVMTFPITQGPTAPIPSPSETAAPGGGSSPPPGTGSGGAGGSATTPLGGANTTGLAPYNPNSGDRIIVGVSTSAALVFALFALFL